MLDGVGVRSGIGGAGDMLASMSMLSSARAPSRCPGWRGSALGKVQVFVEGRAVGGGGEPRITGAGYRVRMMPLPPTQ
jgi:hypothetical protein